MQQDNGGVKPGHPPVMPVVSEVPQVVADEEGKKKKRGFFFKKKKKTKVSAPSSFFDAVRQCKMKWFLTIINNCGPLSDGLIS